MAIMVFARQLWRLDPEAEMVEVGEDAGEAAEAAEAAETAEAVVVLPIRVLQARQL